MYNLLNLRALCVFTVFLFIIGYLYTQRLGASSGLHSSTKTVRSPSETGSDRSWKDVDLHSLKLPEDLEERIKQVVIHQSTVPLGGVPTFLQKASPPSGVAVSGLTVLLLHGAAFDSQTWVTKVPTIATLASIGHRVVAIDLPGYGRTKTTVLDKGAYLNEAISLLSPESAPVVISPSMSGSFMVPLLKDTPEKVSGWVPVAPVGTAKGRPFFPSLSLPTMIVYGEKDTGLGHRSRDDLLLIPTATKPQVLPGASHPAYLDQPELWHELLLNFLTALKT